MIQLGVVAYLNMLPLVAGLDDVPGLVVRREPPSALAALLGAGELDVAMVPIASVLAHPEWTILQATEPDAEDPQRVVGSMIGSRGTVNSVLLIGDGPPEQWRTLRFDSHSMTSNMLARVYLKQCLALDFNFAEPIPFRPEWAPPARPEPGEAMVLIGTRALRWRGQWLRDASRDETRWRAEAARQGWGVVDLGEAWTAWTGLPFAYAVWAARPGLPAGELAALAATLERQKLANRARMTELAATWPTLADEGLDAAGAVDYLTRNIDYDLRADVLAAIDCFAEKLNAPRRVAEARR